MAAPPANIPAPIAGQAPDYALSPATAPPSDGTRYGSENARRRERAASSSWEMTLMGQAARAWKNGRV